MRDFLDFKKLLVSGVVAGIVIFVVSMVFSMLTQMVAPYDITMLGGMRAIDDPLLMLFFAHYWVLGFALSFLYQYVSPSLQGNYLQKGKTFGLIAWIVYVIPSAFVVWSSMNYPIGFTIDQVIGGLIYMILAGITIAKFGE